MKKSHTHSFRKLTTIAAILGLILIGIIFSKKMIDEKPKEETKTSENIDNVLGETVVVSPTSYLPDFSLNNLWQNTVKDTQNIVSQKISETEKTITHEVQKEFSRLTESQIQSLKLQICKDWGVVSVSPTISP